MEPSENKQNPERKGEKAKRAAEQSFRPGKSCRANPGDYYPTVNRNKCEGKSDCVAVCPFDVFEVRRMDDADFARLSIFGRLKSLAHGKQTAYTPGATLCQACGLCVVACPERAVELVRREGA
jgi:NAD-dependent dihydropyrimidine dehydrogenase PreA subunit